MLKLHFELLNLRSKLHREILKDPDTVQLDSLDGLVFKISTFVQSKVTSALTFMLEYIMLLDVAGDTLQWLVQALRTIWIRKFSKLGIKISSFRVFGFYSWSMSSSTKFYVAISTRSFAHFRLVLDGLIDVILPIPF